jgi:hypothetical protein
MEPKIKILVCYHKPDVLIKDEVFTPIHVGRAVAVARNDKNLAWMRENMIGDDTGDNISAENGCYNELSAVYWAWKNYAALGSPDYIGLMHYRRHFVFEEYNGRSVYEFEKIDGEYFTSINYGADTMRRLFEDCDFAYHKGNVGNIYRQYAENGRIEDLDTALKILYAQHKDYKSVAKKFLNGSFGCFCNMFIFPREIFFRYCEFIFSILKEFSRRVDCTEKRFFISERLTGIFVAKLEKEGYKGKPLPLSFINKPVRIDIAVPFDAKNPFSSAVTVCSFLSKADKNTSFGVYLLTENGDCGDCARLISERYSNVEITCVDAGTAMEKAGVPEYMNRREYYPALLGELLPSVGKCFYATGNVIALRDAEEFFRMGNTDDFFVLGIPDVDGRNPKALLPYAYLVNLKKLREHGAARRAAALRTKNPDGGYVVSGVFGEYSGFLPKRFYALAGGEKTARNGICAFAVFDGGYMPYEDIRRDYSEEWWEAAACVPRGIKLFYTGPSVLKKGFAAENERNKKILFPHIIGTAKKAVSYYKRNGFKRMYIRVYEKVFRRKYGKD